MSQAQAPDGDRQALINEHRDLFELIAEGDDEPAEWARQWLQEVDDE